MNLGGSRALILKVSGKESEVESAEIDGFGDVGFLMNSEYEVVAYYSDKKVKKFFKKPFNPKFKETTILGETHHLGRMLEKSLLDFLCIKYTLN